MLTHYTTMCMILCNTLHEIVHSRRVSMADALRHMSDDRVTGSYPKARRVLNECEGVARSQNSWRALLSDVESAMADA